MPRTRVHNMNVSLDGYAAGEHVTFDAPIGGAERLFTWFDGRVIHGVDKADAPVTLDRALTSMWSQGIGAEIMGRRKFGPQVGDWPDDGWRGWWGDDPPFQTPVFVMSHHPHPAIDFPNGTSFRFVDGPPEEVLHLAQQAAGGRDVRIGGGTLDGASVPPGRPGRLHAPGDRADYPRARRLPLGGIKRPRRPLHPRVGHLA
jgi:dihydrofolate reductase